MVIVLNVGQYTGISAEIPVFYPKRYDTRKILPVSFWADISIYWQIFEVKISNISPR